MSRHVKNTKRIQQVKCCDLCYKTHRKDEQGFVSTKYRAWFCGTPCYYVFLLMNGELDKSNSVVYNEVVSMKEKHYPLGLIERNRDKVDYYNGWVYRIVRVFEDDIPSYDDQVAAGSEPVGAD
jgi:hypothetical protein